MKRYLSKEKEGGADTKAADNSRKREIAIVPFESFDLREIKDSLEAAALLYGLEPVFSSDAYLTASLSDAELKRKQRDAVRIITSSKNILMATGEKAKYALVVTKVDLFSERLRFIFGLANQELGVGLLSTARLRVRDGDEVTPAVIKERVLKEAAHEIGHLGGLAHCENPKCLMAFSNSIKEVDQKLPFLCEECKIKLRTVGR